MRHGIIRLIVAMVCFITVFMASPAVAQEPLSAPSGVACPAGDRECASLCQGATGRLQVSRGHPGLAAFFIRRNGDVELERGVPLTFRFEAPGDEPELVARFEVDAGAATQVVACGPVNGADTFELVGLEPREQGSILTVSVFDRLLPRERDRAELIRDGRETALITSELARHEVEEAARLAEVDHARMSYLQEERDMARLEVLSEKATDALEALNYILRQGLLADRKAPSRLVSARAAQASSLANEISSLRSAVHAVRDALTQLAQVRAEEARLGDALRVLKPASSRKQDVAAFETRKAEIESAVHGITERRKEVEQAFVAARDRLVPFKEPPRPLTEHQRVAHCQVMGRLLWFTGDTRRLITRTEIPLVESANLVAVSYGSGPAARRQLSAAPVGLMLTGIPTGTEVTLASKQVERKQPQLVELLAQLFMLVPPSRMLDEKLAGVEPRVPFSFACPGLSSQGGAKVLPDLSAAPVAPQVTRGFLLYGVDSSHTGQVTVCAGNPCDPDDKAAPIKNQVDLESNFSWTRFTLLADFGANVEASPRARRLEAIHGAPRFEPVGGTSGPDQLFMLRHPQSAAQSFSLQLLVAWRPGDHWSLGVGPSLWAGGAPAFSQWNLRAGYAFVPGVSVTAGVGVRSRSNSLDYREGQVIAVARPETGDVSPPSPRTFESLVGVASVGLAVDLAAAGDAGQSLLKSLGVIK